ncbi:protein NYNRIN-like [Rosa chinensis]|uniref:protein NYNRIN-like n=1 Tax=Rosa chinensis TaxID=74649 RepID=UPI001AD8A0A7|nr:protein NYNRIN-like [Rosa chinensis]
MGSLCRRFRVFQGSDAGIILTGPGGLNAEYTLKFNFKASNNMAEYEALIAGLLLAINCGAENVNIFSDSQLVVNQVNDTFQVKDKQLAAYLGYTKTLLGKFSFFNITQIPREKNAKADSLAHLETAQPHQSPSDTRVETLEKPSITKILAKIYTVEVSPNWMNEILNYKRDGTLPSDKVEARRLVRRATWYNIQSGKLYRQGFTHPNLKCLTPEEGKQVLAKIHARECGNHAGARSLANRTMRQGYFWPTLGDDAKEASRFCHKCQQYAYILHAPAEPLSVIITPWIHSMWGLDIFGKLPTAKGQFKYIIVAIDYDSKWIEAEPLMAITTAKVQHFLWKNIYCRYGVPNTIITDNGTQFNNEELINFTAKLGTKMRFASVAHPQTNGQVQSANKIIKKLLKKKLEDKKGLWAEKLPEVL